MIRALLYDEAGKATVLIVINDDNIANLLAERPIRFNLKHIDPDDPERESDLPDVDVVVSYAKDPAAILRELQKKVQP